MAAGFSPQRLAPAWAPVLVALALDAGCGGRSGLEMFGLRRSAGGAAGLGGSSATGGSVLTGGVGASGGVGGVGVGGTGTGGTGVSAGGVVSVGGLGGASGQGGAGPVAGQPAMGGAAPVAGSGGSAGVAGVAGTSGAGGATGGKGAEGGEGGEAGTPEATDLALGAFHSCASFTSGSLRCWGTSGYIGSGTEETIGDDETPSTIPPVDLGGDVQSIAAGWYHTCAVLTNGRVRCFGSAAEGRLGYANAEDIGDDESPASAGNVELGGPVAQISCGPQHTCAALQNGSVRCWGRNAEHQLGHADPEAIGDDEPPASAGNVDVGGNVRMVHVGFNHTCAVLEGGKVRCWGNGSGGKLGYGNTNTIGDDETPASAGDVDVGGEVVSIAVGSVHTCAVLVGGNVRCWGIGTYGVLGYANENDIGDDETPASAGDVDLGGPAFAVAAGDYATCALMSTGAVRCWGRANEGELGYANLLDIGDDETPASAGDVDIGGLATRVDVGFNHVCVIMNTGTVRCWGRGQTGALGYSSLADVGDAETPALVGDVKLWP